MKVKVLDCRAKEVLEIERKGGDLFFTFRDSKGVTFVFAVELKKPYKRSFEKITTLIREMKKYLIERWEEFETV